MNEGDYPSYLVDAYVRASDSWAEFEAKADLEALRDSGAVLCSALTTLARDQRLWTGVEEALLGEETDVEGVQELLDDVEAFLDLEKKVLARAGMNEKACNRLIAGTLVAGRGLFTAPTRRDIGYLRERIRELATLQCALVDMHERRRFIRRLVETTWVGVKTIGGGSLIGANLAAPMDPVSKAGSVLGGLTMIESVLRRGPS